jgi:Transketolase, thiamine diphosphate binding domain
MVGLLQETHPVGLTEPKFIANSTISMNGVNGKNDTKATNNFQSGTATLPKNKSNKGWRADLDEDDYAVLGLRNFIFDICNHNGGGHGGSAIGMAAIGVALYKYIMRYNPSDPSWFDRDRFVLSNGMYGRSSFPSDALLV